MSALTLEDGRLLGDWQQPINRWAEGPNSIHNDAVAQKIGMRGGTIPGTVHLAHFQPIIEQLFGGPNQYERDQFLEERKKSIFHTLYYGVQNREKTHVSE
jgi:hypothetical protein